MESSSHVPEVLISDLTTDEAWLKFLEAVYGGYAYGLGLNGECETDAKRFMSTNDAVDWAFKRISAFCGDKRLLGRKLSHDLGNFSGSLLRIESGSFPQRVKDNFDVVYDVFVSVIVSHQYAFRDRLAVSLLRRADITGSLHLLVDRLRKRYLELEIQLVVPDDACEVVCVIEDVLTHLANAVKNSEDSGATVVRIEAVNNDAGVSLFVDDNGRGISDDFADPRDILLEHKSSKGSGLGIRALEMRGILPIEVKRKGELGGASFWYLLSERYPELSFEERFKSFACALSGDTNGVRFSVNSTTHFVEGQIRGAADLTARCVFGFFVREGWELISVNGSVGFQMTFTLSEVGELCFVSVHEDLDDPAFSVLSFLFEK